MGTLPTPLNPFSSPHRPINPMTAPEQLRGNDNQTARALNEHTQDADLHTVTTTTAGVTTSAATIYPAITDIAYALVRGNDGAGKTFVDQVVWNGTTNVVAVVSSTTIDGIPALRTYTVASGILKVQVVAGTYQIAVVPISL